VGERLGAEKLAFWAKNFHLGRPTGIDLPAEIAGLVPSPQWKKETKGEDWFWGILIILLLAEGISAYSASGKYDDQRFCQWR